MGIPVGAQDPLGERIAGALPFTSQQKCTAAQELLRTVPESAREADSTRRDLAQCYLNESRWEEADAVLGVLLSRSPPYHPALFLRAYLLLRTGQFEKSLELISQYLQKTPDQGEARKIRSLDYFMLGRHREAELEMKRAAELNPSDPETFYYLGRLYFNRKDILAAVEALKKALHLDPSNVKFQDHLGYAYEGLGDFAAAREAYLKAIELEQRQAANLHWPYYNLGLLCLKEGKTQEAVTYLRQSRAKNPSWPDGKVKLARAFVTAGKPEEAIVQLKQVLQADPENADAHYQLARALNKMGKRDKAQQHFLVFQKLKKP